jgi:hypothetical protein
MQPATRRPSPVSLSKAVFALLPAAIADAYCAGQHTTDGSPQVYFQFYGDDFLGCSRDCYLQLTKWASQAHSRGNGFVNTAASNQAWSKLMSA